MDVEAEIRDLKRRVGELEGSFGFLTEQVRNVHRDLLDFEARTEQRFDGVDKRFDRVEARLDALDRKLDSKIDGVNSRIDGVDSKIDGLVTALPGIIGDALREYGRKL